MLFIEPELSSINMILGLTGATKNNGTWAMDPAKEAALMNETPKPSRICRDMKMGRYFLILKMPFI